ncbi:hypothetical protein AGLY_006791 [Aphis glycines]|uniref:Uncharacterized protein n=1 Tax=Aphis glycines TaxID=307491 RepID=A0A6G0TRI2_APHGL|nr:hypothetical protein AGLY_006791 [Aphis glycines]
MRGKKRMQVQMTNRDLREVGVHVAIILVIPNHVYYFVSFMIFINLLLLLVDYGLQDHPCKQICRHLSLSSAASFHCVFGSTALTSFLIRSSHRKRGLPNGLFPVGFSLITALMKEPSFLQACPAHINLLLLISDIISVSSLEITKNTYEITPCYNIVLRKLNRYKISCLNSKQ